MHLESDPSPAKPSDETTGLADIWTAVCEIPSAANPAKLHSDSCPAETSRYKCVCFKLLSIRVICYTTIDGSYTSMGDSNMQPGLIIGDVH